MFQACLQQQHGAPEQPVLKAAVGSSTAPMPHQHNTLPHQPSLWTQWHIFVSASFQGSRPKYVTPIPSWVPINPPHIFLYDKMALACYSLTLISYHTHIHSRPLRLLMALLCIVLCKKTNLASFEEALHLGHAALRSVRMQPGAGGFS